MATIQKITGGRNSEYPGFIDELIFQFYPHGLAVKSVAGIPINLFPSICSAVETKWPGQEIMMDASLSRVLGATMVLGPSEELKLWRQEHEQSIKDEPPLLRWWRGTDTGLSSMYLVTLITGFDAFGITGPFCFDREPHYPSDADDFGRCYRAIEAIGIRGCLYVAVEKDPRWAKYVEAWDELNAAMEEGWDACSAKVREIYNSIFPPTAKIEFGNEECSAKISVEDLREFHMKNVMGIDDETTLTPEEADDISAALTRDLTTISLHQDSGHTLKCAMGMVWGSRSCSCGVCEEDQEK